MPVKRVKPVPSDIEIAQAARLRPIRDVAAELGLKDYELTNYGTNKAKVNLDALETQLAESGGPWILGGTFSLADVSWMVIFERLRQVDNEHVFVGGGLRPACTAYWERLKELAKAARWEKGLDLAYPQQFQSGFVRSAARSLRSAVPHPHRHSALLRN